MTDKRAIAEPARTPGEYAPDMPSLREFSAGFWAIGFPGFEAAVRHWSLLYAAFGCDPDDAREGDREKAIELQDEALAITQELGMRPLTERILARREILRA